MEVYLEKSIVILDYVLLPLHPQWILKEDEKMQPQYCAGNSRRKTQK